MSSSGKAKATDEDLDDLDDVLEEFTKPPSTQLQSTQTKSSPSIPPNASASKSTAKPAETAEDEEFAKQLATEMEAMMRAIGGDTDASAAELDPDALAQQEAYREAWNKLLIQDLEGDGKGNGLDALLRGPGASSEQSQGEGGSKNNDESKTDESAEDPFQKAIRQAMDKLQDSDDTFKADSQNAGKDTLENLMSSLGELNLGEGEGGEDIESLLETMMSQLMSKEILYEPLKELDTKYPEYLSEHSSTLSQEELKRYTDQKERVSQIISIFENPSYSDDNASQGTEVLRLMNEMQSFGSPPSEIMGPMPPGFEFGTDGLPKIPDGCLIA